MRRSIVMLLLASCASPKPAPPEPVAFDEAPVVEPEAGPAPVVPDAATPEPAAPEVQDAGVVAAAEPAADTGPAPVDAGRPDAGKLVEPLLPDEAGKKRFEAALKKAFDDPAGAESDFEAIAAQSPEFYFAHYN